MRSPLPRMLMYFGAKSLSTSMPNWLFGKSRRWPIEARTMYLRPRYFSMVLALAGDSTTTSVFFVAARFFVVFFAGFFTAFLTVAVSFSVSSIFSAVAGTSSLPFRAHVSVRIIFLDEAFELHLQEHE